MSEKEISIAIGERLERIASALEQLVINQKARMINEALQQEDKQFNKESIEETEEVIMDLKEVTVMAKTDLSLLVSKKGYQKWVAFSLMAKISKDDYEPGEYIEDILIRDDKKVWFNEKKSWDKLKVVKN